MTVIESPKPSQTGAETTETNLTEPSWTADQFPDGSFKLSKGLITYRVYPPSKPVQVGSASSEPMLSEPEGNPQTLGEWALAQAQSCKQLLFDYDLVTKLDQSAIKHVKKGYFFNRRDYLEFPNGTKLTDEQAEIYLANSVFKKEAEKFANATEFNQYIAHKISAVQKAVDEEISTEKKKAQNKGEAFNPSEVVIGFEPLSDTQAEKEWSAVSKAIARQVFGYKTQAGPTNPEPTIDLTTQQ